MRNPPPRMDVPPDDRLEGFLNEVLAAQSTLEKLTAVYGILRPALLAAYRDHTAQVHPLVDHPTKRLLRLSILEETETVAWGAAAIEALGGMEPVQDWINHLNRYLDAAGGIVGENTTSGVELPQSRHLGEFHPDFFPRRDARFVQQDNFVFPPHEVARMAGISDDEKTLALMCKRALEMDVPEVMARIIAESDQREWSYYVDMCRQLWDESRHAMMGAVYLQDRGIDWKREIPLHPGFALRLNQHMNALEAHAVLYTIEQNLMPADTGKKYEWETASADPLAKLFQDFDWADEVLHVHIGRKWGLAASGMSRAEFIAIGQRMAVESENALQQYAPPEKQVNWWEDFVLRILGRPSAVTKHEFNTGDPVYRASTADS